MKCTNCCRELPAGSAFCPNCGIHLAGRTVPANPIPQASRQHTLWIVALVVVLFIGIGCVTGVVLIDRLYANQQISAPAITVGVIPSDTPVIEAPASSAPNDTISTIADDNLIGLWSTEGPSGELVDPVTGYAAGSVYNGEWYLFRDDGTYRYVIVSSGIVVDGGVVCEGSYAISNGEILLTGIRESWYPNPAAVGQTAAYQNKRIDDIVLQYQYGDEASTLIINNADYFTRVES